MAMSSSLHTDNAPPAARSTSTTRGHEDGSKRYVTNCILKTEKKKKNSSLTSFQTASDWVRIPVPPPVSVFLFWRGVIFRKGWGHLLTPTGEGPARNSGVQQGTNASRESEVLVPLAALIHKSLMYVCPLADWCTCAPSETLDLRKCVRAVARIFCTKHFDQTPKSIFRSCLTLT